MWNHWSQNQSSLFYLDHYILDWEVCKKRETKLISTENELLLFVKTKMAIWTTYLIDGNSNDDVMTTSNWTGSVLFIVPRDINLQTWFGIKARKVTIYLNISSSKFIYNAPDQHTLLHLYRELNFNACVNSVGEMTFCIWSYRYRYLNFF